MKLRRRAAGSRWRDLLPRDREARPWLLALGGVVLAFLAGYLVAGQLLFPPPGEADDAPVVDVPSVEGLTLEEASVRLDEAGLALRVAHRPAAAGVDSGLVMGQRPLPGQMARAGDPVELVVNRGAGRVRIPGLRGLAEERARSILEALGLEVTSRREPSPVRQGEVVETEPPAGGELRPPAEIQLVVSEGPEVARVPELAGRHVDDVPAILRRADLELGAVEFDPDAAAAPGRVVGQSPPPDFALRRGGSVSVRVAGTRGDWSRPAPGTADPDTSAAPGGGD